MYELIVFVLILIFGILSIYYDLKYRKVPNQITFSFLIISLIIFILNINSHNLFNEISLIFVIFLSFIIYYYNFWGAADGKLFIAICMLFFSIQNWKGTLNFLLNTIFLYSITMIIFSLIVTDIKSKKKVFKKIKYLEHIFFILVIFILGALNYNYLFNNVSHYVFLGISLGLIFILMLFTNKLKKILRKQKKIIKQLSVVFMFFILLILSTDTILNYFFLVLFVKISIDYISRLCHEIDSKGKIYESPFSLYLFFGAIITIIIELSLFDLIISLI